MIQRIGKRKYKVFAMDIETHNDEESIRKKESSMWLGCMIDESSRKNDKAIYFYTMKEFIDMLKSLSKKTRNKAKTRLISNVLVYIYNLSFEYSFLLPELIKEGFQYKDEIGKDDENVFNSVTTKSCSSVWLVNISFGNKYGRVTLRDLAKLYGGGLGNVAKSFKLETQKGEIDYRLNRLHHHIITWRERLYIFKDVRIIIDILLHMDKLGDKDFWQSSSMASYSMRKLLKAGYPRCYRPYQEFRKSYPELSEEETNFLRLGVAGGLTEVNPKYQFIDYQGKVGHCDKHQMHPSSAYFNWFPCETGQYFTGRPPLGKISCCRIRVTYSGVLFHSIISLIGTDIIADKEIVVWGFEIPTMYKCYVNLKVEYIDGYAYKMKTLPWKRYYADNYRKRLIAKKEKDAFNILYYKLLNNSSYGKLLEKPHNVILENCINEMGIIDSRVKPKDVISISAKYTYLPVGSAIPAYSRVDLIESAWKISHDFSKILYVDTDSIFFIWDEETEKIWNEQFNHDDFFGGWGWEEMIDRAQFTAPKRYKTETDNVPTFKAGGINFKQFVEDYKKENDIDDEDFGIGDVPYDEINIISSKYKVQRAFRCKGGTLIDFQEKEVKVPKKYIDIFENNMV